MLPIQRQDFDVNQKDEGPYPRDFARWNALDYFRRPRPIRSRRFWVTLGAALGAVLVSAATLLPALHRTHQAGPVSRAHAMFGHNCAVCHDQMFQPVRRLFGAASAASVSDHACMQCHDGAPHPGEMSHGSAQCVTCHQEHRGHEVQAPHVADRHLLGRLTYGGTPLYITNFNRDHPEFEPSKAGQKDGARIRFNHKVHLGLPLEDLKRAGFDLPAFNGAMQCTDCHQLDDQRRYFLPIKYDHHCASCHRLKVALTGFAADSKEAAEFAKVPLPHREPAVVRAVLQDRLVEIALKHNVVPGQAKPVVAPRLLPWKPFREVADAEWNWATSQRGKEESRVFLKFASDQQKKWQGGLTWCSHCHVENTAAERVNDLPVFHATEIPLRWYKKSKFNHGSHRMMRCEQCHDDNLSKTPVRQSDATEHILLPTLQSCKECHHGNSPGVRNECATCHRYHDRQQERSPDGAWTIEDILKNGR